MKNDGIWDDFQTFVEEHGQTNTMEKPFLFVNMVVFLWPFVCGSCIAVCLEEKYCLETFFRGGAAKTFRLIVEALGFNEETYPYIAATEDEEDNDVKVKVLMVWTGLGNRRLVFLFKTLCSIIFWSCLYNFSVSLLHFLS